MPNEYYVSFLSVSDLSIIRDDDQNVLHISFKDGANRLMTSGRRARREGLLSFLSGIVEATNLSVRLAAGFLSPNSEEQPASFSSSWKDHSLTRLSQRILLTLVLGFLGNRDGCSLIYLHRKRTINP